MEISGPGCRFPDVAFGSVSRKFLVVWADYNAGRIFGRLMTGDGTMSAGPFAISEAEFGALYPAVAFNTITNEFLVTWDDAGDRGGVIFAQRVRGADGALTGNNFAIGSIFGGIRSAVASSPHGYLVVYWGPGNPDIEIYGQRVTAAGALLGSNFNISNDGVFSGYPAVSHASLGDQFLVTWDNEDGNIHGRRLDASNGALVGNPLIITSGGAKDRSCAAYDSVNNRWLVQFNDNANPGYSYDQFGRLVAIDGTLSGGLLPLAHSMAFEGDTQFGGDVAFDPLARRFFSSFGTDTGMGGQESLNTGAPVGSQITLGTGFYTSLNVWDDLFMKIDTAANTTEFFFNGQSFGALSHGTAATAIAGAIRLERLDRTTAGSDFIEFDNLAVGAVDSSPLRFSVARQGGQFVLAWPATGTGAALQTSLDLVTWNAITDPLVTANCKTTYGAATSPDARFFRLRRR